MSGFITVVGSLSLDLVVQTPRRPGKGETISGTNFATFVGGKGNNQALAAARAGAAVRMVGRVGKDAYGEQIARTLAETGVDTSCLYRDTEIGTGIANIWVDPAGDNSIVIVPQANSRLSPEDVNRAASSITGAAIVLLQMEIPLETTIAAARLAHQAGVIVALNPAPAPPGGVPVELLKVVDLLIPNETEAQLLCGMPITDQKSAVQAAEQLQKLGPKRVIITLGSQGALLLDESSEARLVPSFPVKAVDTTAAGDAFCGALAAALARGESLKEATVYGCAAGAMATTKPGAEPSLPTSAQIAELLSTRAAQPA